MKRRRRYRSLSAGLAPDASEWRELEAVKGVRDRYNGENRNPWNEFECGSNFWSIEGAWGTYKRSGQKIMLKIESGELQRR